MRGASPKNKYPDELRKKVMAADAKGDKTRKQIAKDFGIHPYTVYDWCGTKAEVRKAQANRECYRKDAKELYWEGYTYSYIAKQLGIPVSTVWDYVNREYVEGN